MQREHATKPSEFQDLYSSQRQALKLLPLATYCYLKHVDGYFDLGYVLRSAPTVVQVYEADDDAALLRFLKKFRFHTNTLWYRVNGCDWRNFPFADDTTPPEVLVGWIELNVGLMRDEWSVPDDWREVVERYGILQSYVTRPVGVGGRSSIQWRLVMRLKEKGATPGEAMCVLGAARCWTDKFGNDPARLRRTVGKAYARN